MQGNVKKIFYRVSMIVLFGATLFLSVYFSRNACFCGEDFNFATYFQNESVFDCLFGESRFQHGGYYVGLFLCKFLSFGLPNILSLHPSDFIGEGQGWLKGIFLFLILLNLANFSVICSKNLLLKLTTFVFAFSYLFYYAGLSHGLCVNYTFYRYVFSLLFFGIFVFAVCKNIFSKSENYNNQKCFLLAINAFVLGTSLEVLSLTALIFSLGLIVHNIFIKLIGVLRQNENRLFLSKSFYISFVSLLLGMALFYSNAGTQIVISDRTNGIFDLHSLKEYLLLFNQVCIADVAPILIAITVLFTVALYFGFRDKEYTCVFVPMMLLASIYAFMLGLYFCGKSFDEFTRDRYYLYHFNIVLVFKLLLLYPMFLLVGYCYDKVSTTVNVKWLKIACISAVYIGLGISACCFASKTFVENSHSDSAVEMADLRKNFYMTEKILRFYYLKNQQPIIPLYPVIPEFVSADYSKQYCSDGRCETVKCYENHSFSSSYYYRVYMDENALKYGFCTSNNALKYYENNGGTFYEFELENPKFSRLFDEKFVLK